MSKELDRVTARAEAAMVVFRAAPTAEAVDAAMLLGIGLGRLQLMDALSEIEPTAYRNDAATGADWVAAIPVRKIRQVLEDA